MGELHLRMPEKIAQQFAALRQAKYIEIAPQLGIYWQPRLTPRAVITHRDREDKDARAFGVIHEHFRLLGERFKLAIRRETRPMTAFVLQVAKNGPKKEKAAPGESGTNTTNNNTETQGGGGLTMVIEVIEVTA